MSLPGLQLSAPVETAVVPTIQDLTENTEWRFEVAFGTKVEVRVRPSSLRSLSKLRSFTDEILLSFYQELLSFSAQN